MTDPYDHKTTKKSLRFLKSFLKMVVFLTRRLRLVVFLHPEPKEFLGLVHLPSFEQATAHERELVPSHENLFGEKQYISDLLFYLKQKHYEHGRHS